MVSLRAAALFAVVAVAAGCAGRDETLTVDGYAASLSAKEICVAGTPNADTRACYDLTDESEIPDELEEGAKVTVTVELASGRRPDDVISVKLRD